MKIFVAYGYNERDKWIEKMVFPIIRAFGSEVESGEAIYDGAMPDGVRINLARRHIFVPPLLCFSVCRRINEIAGKLNSINKKLT